MRVFLSFVISLLMLLTSASAVSHHSFSAEFDVGRPVELTGTVTEIEWTNPHAWVFIDVKGEDGKVHNWAIELLGINALIRRGMSPKNGNVVVPLLLFDSYKPTRMVRADRKSVV